VDRRSGSVSEASEADILDSLDDGKPDDVDAVESVEDPHRTVMWRSASEANTLTNEPNRGLLEKSSSASLPCHVKHLVRDLESRYSINLGPQIQPAPAVQSCPKITALRDTLISRVQDPRTSKASPVLQNSPNVLALRDSLVSRVQVPATSKISTPTLQSCPKITSLQETLISRVQDPGTSQTSRVAQQDLARCPSVASRQTALLDAALGRTTSASSTSLKNVLSIQRNEPDDGLLNSRDKPEPDCQDVTRTQSSVHGPVDILSVSNGTEVGPKFVTLEDGLHNQREVPEDEQLNRRDGPDYGVQLSS